MVVVECFQVFGELECRVDLYISPLVLPIAFHSKGRGRHTSCKSIKGGPSWMSSAFVPGRIRRLAPVSVVLPESFP